MQETKSKFSENCRNLSVTCSVCSFGLAALAYFWPQGFGKELGLPGEFYGFLLMAIALVGVAVFFHGQYSKCPNCGKKHAMIVQSKNFISESSDIVKKGEYYSGSKKVRQYARETKQWFHIHRKCKYCGTEDYLVRTEKK